MDRRRGGPVPADTGARSREAVTFPAEHAAAEDGAIDGQGRGGQ